MAVIDVNEKNFNEKVLKGSEKGLVIVDFYADWCGPCRALGPLLEVLANEYNITLARINVDENPTLASSFEVMSIPNVKFFKNKKVVAEFVGAVPEDYIRKLIEKTK